MADSKKVEIENAMHNQIQDIDKLYFRKLQKVTYECSAKCCENSKASTQDVQHCVDKCGKTLMESQNFVYSEISHYQNRLQRCLSECNDEARDQLGTNPSEAKVEKASLAFENCACKCIDKHISILPQFMSKIHEVMAKKVSGVKGDTSVDV